MGDIRKQRPRAPLADRGAYTIKEFCALHALGVSTFYTLKPDERPKDFHIGKRRFISSEAAAEWRRERERRETASATTRRAL